MCYVFTTFKTFRHLNSFTDSVKRVLWRKIWIKHVKQCHHVNYMPVSHLRVHPAVCHRRGSKGARRGRRRLLFRELHVRLFRGRGSGHGVVVRGAVPWDGHELNRLLVREEQKLSSIFIFKQDCFWVFLGFFFLQSNKDFYHCRKICSVILLNIYLCIGFQHHMPFTPETLFGWDQNTSFIFGGLHCLQLGHKSRLSSDTSTEDTRTDIQIFCLLPHHRYSTTLVMIWPFISRSSALFALPGKLEEDNLQPLCVFTIRRFFKKKKFVKVSLFLFFSFLFFETVTAKGVNISRTTITT